MKIENLLFMKRVEHSDLRSRKVLQRLCSLQIFEQKVKVSIVVSGADTRLTLETPEAYTLDVVTQDQVTKVNVSSLSVFGARHGLETLSQLIAFDEDEGAFRVSVGGGGIILDPILLAYKSLEALGIYDKQVCIRYSG